MARGRVEAEAQHQVPAFAGMTVGEAGTGENSPYSPPKRERILEWQAQQDFPIIPNADDPDAGNLYRELKFPDRVYDHITEYYEEKAQEASA